MQHKDRHRGSWIEGAEGWWGWAGEGGRKRDANKREEKQKCGEVEGDRKQRKEKCSWGGSGVIAVQKEGGYGRRQVGESARRCQKTVCTIYNTG